MTHTTHTTHTHTHTTKTENQKKSPGHTFPLDLPLPLPGKNLVIREEKEEGNSWWNKSQLHNPNNWSIIWKDLLFIICRMPYKPGTKARSLWKKHSKNCRHLWTSTDWKTRRYDGTSTSDQFSYLAPLQNENAQRDTSEKVTADTFTPYDMCALMIS